MREIMIEMQGLVAAGAGGECPAACPSLTSEIHQFAESLGKAIDAKDHFTSQHSEQVACLAHALALGLGISAAGADHIHIAGHLHDIGKIGLPDRILHQTNKLSGEDWREIKKHPRMGADIIAPVNFLSQNGIVDMVWAHHESFDGTGYPRGLRGGQIPLGARIIAVADSLSAMLQNRPYRPKMTFEQALDDIARLSGKRYDPLVVRALWGQAEKISHLTEYLEMGEEIREDNVVDCSGPTMAQSSAARAAR